MNRTAAFAHQNGVDKAATAFNDPKGAFVQYEAYVFAGDYNGTALTDPFPPELVDTNI
ncbi:MAG: hypothetical protein WCF90_10415 [Methanomicrobiales archaeon]